MSSTSAGVLGAILAGGRSRRFGSDKARALLDGRPLIEHVAAALRPQCDLLVVVGADLPGHLRVEDRPVPGLGPLGGLLGALRHARMSGHAVVLTSGCDLPGLPGGLLALLSPAPAVLAQQPTVGLWPSALADALADHLLRDERRSIQGWIAAADARRVEGPPLANINTTADLAAFRRRADPRSSR